MFKALTMYPVWDKWIMPRCDVIPSEYYDDPEKWALSNIDAIKGPRATLMNLVYQRCRSDSTDP